MEDLRPLERPEPQVAHLPIGQQESGLQTTKSRQVVEEGTFLSGRSGRAAPRIKIVYPSADFRTAQEKALTSQCAIEEEAQEHYLIMQTIAREDLFGYRRWARATNARKTRVRKVLTAGNHWQLIRSSLYKQ